MYLIGLFLTMVMLMFAYIERMAHDVYAPKLTEELSLQCLDIEKMIKSADKVHSLHRKFLRYQEIMEPIWSGTSWFETTNPEYTDGRTDHDLAFRVSVGSLHEKYLIEEGSTTKTYKIPGCINYAVTFRMRDLSQHQPQSVEKVQGNQEMDSFLAKKGIISKTTCFQEGGLASSGDICLQEKATSISNFWMMFPDDRDQLIKALMIYEARIERYDVRYEGGLEHIGVYHDKSVSNKGCGTTLAVRLLDTEGVTVGNQRADWSDDFVYYPDTVADHSFDDVICVLAKITGKEKCEIDKMLKKM